MGRRREEGGRSGRRRWRRKKIEREKWKRKKGALSRRPACGVFQPYPLTRSNRPQPTGIHVFPEKVNGVVVVSVKSM